MRLRPTAFALSLLSAAAVSQAALAADAVCQAHSGRTVPTVVELYTSQGCSSCPPAERWLTGLVSRPDVITLAFHVDYWDNLGWKDPFSKAAYTERQHQWQRRARASFVYTPQVLVNGGEYKQWGGVGVPAGAPASVEINLSRQGATIEATVAPLASAHGRLSGYWAVVEDHHVTAIGAGENAGRTLQHDGVVQVYTPVAEWPADQPQHFSVPAPASQDAQHPRRIVFVVQDASTATPVQAVTLPC